MTIISLRLVTLQLKFSFKNHQNNVGEREKKINDFNIGPESHKLLHPIHFRIVLCGTDHIFI